MNNKIAIPQIVDFDESMSNSYNYDAEFICEDKFWIKAKQNYEDFFVNGIKDQGQYRIPKIIHQIWLGSELPRKYKIWADSWQKYHPEWKYILWTDEKVSKLNFDHPDIFYKTKNFGAKSDILRYELLNRYGGLYVDTDFECFCSFDYLHMNVDLYAGIEFGKELSTSNCIIASSKGNPVIKDLLAGITEPITTDDTGVIHQITGPWAFSRVYKENMFNSDLKSVLLPVTYFFPFPNNKLHIQSRSKIMGFKKSETMGIHYWEVSWLNRRSFSNKVRSKILRYISPKFKRRVKRILGK